MRKFLLYSILLLALPAHLLAHVYLRVGTGGVLNLPTQLTISQLGYPDITYTTGWDSKPFTQTIFYDILLGGDIGFLEFDGELIGYKLFPNSLATDVQAFNISKGFLIYGAVACKVWIGKIRFGIGPLFVTPTSTVRNLTFTPGSGFFPGGGGYYLVGPSVELGYEVASKPVLGFLYAFGEVNGAATWVKLPIENGSAQFANYALMFIFGLGVRF